MFLFHFLQLPKLLKDHWEELLLQYIGVVTVSICGVLLALLIPLAGFCLCCCRCAGKYHNSQYVQWILNKIENTLNQIFTGKKSMH